MVFFHFAKYPWRLICLPPFERLIVFFHLHVLASMVHELAFDGGCFMGWKIKNGGWVALIYPRFSESFFISTYLALVVCLDQREEVG
jgi:hypothetical protein